MMSNELPQYFRKPKPPKPKTIEDMQIGESCLAKSSDLHIDRTWRVWLNPNLAIEKKGPLPVPGYPIRVERAQDGYYVQMSLTDKLEGTFEAPGAVEKYAEFILAAKVEIMN